MATYLISYDLSKPGRNYDELYKAIKAYPSWAHLMDSTWAVRTPATAAAVRDHLFAHMDGNDLLYVGRLTGEAAWINLPADVSTWLKQAVSA